MGSSVFPAATVSSIATGWTAGVAGTFLLSNTLSAGTYIINTDTTQSMTISLIDSNGHAYAGTIRGGSGFINVSTSVNQIKIPGSLTYPFGITINQVAVPQLAAPTSLSLSFSVAGITGTWGSVPSGATGAVLFTTTGDVINFSSTASGAVASPITTSNTVPNSTNQFVVAFKNSSGAYGIGATYSLAMPALYPYLAEYLVVGQGGYGKWGGGGGGAVKTGSTYEITPGNTLTVTVGTTALTDTGASSVFGTVTGVGGGNGNILNATASSGASGAGGASQGNTTVYSGGTGTDGFNGGNSVSPNTTYISQGGGGGAGSAGSGWNSGNGVASSITGSSIYYGAGGAGGQYTSSGAAGTGGVTRNNAGTTNRGNGGGSGGTSTSYAGGTGFVSVAYASANPAWTTIPGTLTYTVDTSSRPGYRIYNFTAGTGTVTI
jgi:hypothetical protein